ncbi:cysteine repeat modular protein 2, putative, partial [Hepatocystis sp. ex Piliocolobus tephrosceles]
GYIASKTNYFFVDFNINKLTINQHIILKRYKSKKVEKVCFYQKASSFCTGKLLECTTDITESKYIGEENTFLDRVSLTKLTVENYDRVVEACGGDGNDLRLLSNVIPKPFILHNYYDIDYLHDFNLPPDDIRTYVMEHTSLFLYYFPNLLQFMKTENIDFIYISFLCYSTKNTIIITYNYDKVMTPMYLKQIKIGSPSSCVLKLDNGLFLYVLTKKNPTILLINIVPADVEVRLNKIKFDSFSPRVKNIISYCLDYYIIKELPADISPILMEPIYTEDGYKLKESPSSFFVITSNPNRKILIIDNEFSILYSHDNDQVKDQIYSSRNAGGYVKYKRDIFSVCSYLITDITCLPIKINLEHNHLVQCFLIDKLRSMLLSVKYAFEENILFIHMTFKGNKNVNRQITSDSQDYVFNESDNYLHKPEKVLVFNYMNSSFLLVTEEGTHQINMLRYYYEDQNPTIEFTTKINNAHLDKGTLEGAYTFYDHHETTSKNAVLFIYYYENKTQFLFIPLSKFINSNPLKYKYEPLIANNQSSYIMKLNIDQLTQMNLLYSFTLMTPINYAVAMSSNDGSLELMLYNLSSDKINISVKIDGPFIEQKAIVNLTVYCRDGLILKDGECKKCPIGTYYNFTEYLKDQTRDECIDCPINTTTKNIGSTKITQCMCVPGYKYEQNNECTQCDVGTWKPFVDNSQCIF